FAVFFVVVLTGSWLLMRRRTAWKLFMVAASYLFYGAWDWRYTVLLAGSTIVNQLAAQAIAASDDDVRRKRLVGLAVAANLGVLGWFKYYGFFVSSAVNALDRVGIEASVPLLEIVLPVGISFFTFQALSYVIDVHRRELEVAPWLDTFLFVSFFPQLVAGPIVRGTEFLPQLRAPRDPRAIPATRAFGLILGGLFKKVVIANVLATSIVDKVFANPSNFSGPEVLLGVYGYAIQIYADFSGYTDIAIGVALLLGFRFPQNFNAPYSALSIRDFWRRWHMTLSRWLRDYLYIPLGGSRGTAARTRAALMATMVLGGLWHGAAWTFVAWGALHGVGLAIERATGQGKVDAASMSLAERFTRRFVTFHFVCLGWVFFRANSFGNALDVLGSMVSPGSLAAATPTVLALILVGLAIQYVPRTWGLRLDVAVSHRPPVLVAIGGGIALLLIDALGPEGIAPFIYFQF
ncbi:MAG: alginate O-acetyltransferase complex protein AlgI, partial [Glaciecola sp.]